MVFKSVDLAWASGRHMVIKCTCGEMLTQCRCFENPENPRPVNYVQDGCSTCQAKLEKTI